MTGWKKCSLQFVFFLVTILEIIRVTYCSPIGKDNSNKAEEDKFLSRQEGREVKNTQIYDVKNNYEQDDYAHQSPLENSQVMKGYKKIKERLAKEENLEKKAEKENQVPSWKRKVRGRERGKTRKHIARLPQPPSPSFGDPPSGLDEDQKHSGDDEYEDTISSQKEAFEAILDANQQNPKRPKALNEDLYIILTYDYKIRKYSIREEE